MILILGLPLFFVFRSRIAARLAAEVVAGRFKYGCIEVGLLGCIVASVVFRQPVRLSLCGGPIVFECLIDDRLECRVFG